MNQAQLDPPARDLATVTTAWSDRWFDPERRLLWNPPGSFTGILADRSVHLVPGSAWYALGLLMRGGDGDHGRACDVIAALLDLQYDRPGEIWHGTFARFAESPEPPPDAVEWDHYDPNWRQFVGTTWLLVLRHFEASLPASLVTRLDRSLRLAVEGEPPGRIDATYTNIALMRSVLEVEGGTRRGEPGWPARGHALAQSVVDRHARTGAFDEHNSPTYYGIDLYGLALWRTCPVSAHLPGWGAALEAALWSDTAAFWHGGLGNLCGPYTRSYGMDLHRYVGAVCLWLWAGLGRDAAPLPDLDADVVAHGHDVCLGPAVAVLGSPIPPGMADSFRRFRGAASVERTIGEGGRRRATAWMADDLMLGGEDNDLGWPAWHQFHPATIHWRAPGHRQSSGNVGSVRLVHNGPVAAEAGTGRLDVACGPPSDASSLPTFLVEVDELAPSGITSSRWELPGLVVEVDTDAVLDAVLPFGAGHLVVYRPPAVGAASCRFVLRPRLRGPENP
jgi:hypothetical protein